MQSQHLLKAKLGIKQISSSTTTKKIDTIEAEQV
jgi:hypothetical protein